MGKLEFGTLREAWKGEATDFTPLLAQQVDAIGSAIGVELAAVGKVEVPTAGSRNIDILAEGDGGTSYVIENQYGTLNHDHLTRGLAYAVAAHARGLIVIAERHRDEFREVAHYLNELRDNDPERGVAVWLVEAKVVRIDDSAWAPLFLPVVSPNKFNADVALEQAKIRRRMDRKDFDETFESKERRKVVGAMLDDWNTPDRRHRIMAYPPQAVLESRGPGVGGWRTVIGIYPDGKVAVPFGSYKGLRNGYAIDALATKEFRARANSLFGFDGSEVEAKTAPDWLTAARLSSLKNFADEVATSYFEARIAYDESNSPED
jgi:hypothetical protein